MLSHPLEGCTFAAAVAEMSRFSDVKVALEEVFRQRMEEVQAGEFVSELGAKKRSSQPRLLVLCRPLSSGFGSSSATLNIVSVATNRQGMGMKLKQAFAVDRLVDIAHDGNYDATFNFGASGMLSVSFESHIQREMFVAAFRRLQDLTGGRHPSKRDTAADTGVIRGVLSAAVGAEAAADAASRVRKLRQEKRRIFTVEEEQYLLKHMRGTSFDNVKGFQEVLLARQKEAELTSLDLLVRSMQAWDVSKNQVIGLVGKVEELEGRIEEYSSHLLSKKGVVTEVEHTNNTLRRKQQNLEQLYVMMAEIRDQLSLNPSMLALLRRLRTEKDATLIAFFSEGNNAQMLSEAMRHMQMVLHNPKLDADYPIAAVTERKQFFLEQRRMIAGRSKTYIMEMIAKYEGIYLADKTRFSRGDRLVWRLHSELTSKLLCIGDIIQSLSKIDMEGFMCVLRRYRTGMQKVYSLEVSRFLKGLRKQVKKVHPFRGPFLLGSSASSEQAMAMRMETAQAGETPRLYRGTPAVSPQLTPRLMASFEEDSNAGGRASTAGGDATLSIEFPSSSLFASGGIELYADPNTIRRLEVKAAGSSVLTNLKSLSPDSTTGGGHVRTDLAFAMALQSVAICILHEEYIMHKCFDLTDAAPDRDPTTAAGHTSAITESAVGGGDGGRGQLPEQQNAEMVAEERAALLLESLKEIFAGDTIASLADATGAGCGDPYLGLPPRYPVGQQGSSPPSRRSSQTDTLPDANSLRKSPVNFLVREMVDLTKFMMEKCDRIYAIPALCMVRAYHSHPSMLTVQSTYCKTMLKEVENVLMSAVMTFVADQTESIARCRKRYLIKPTALMHCFARMPAFIQRMEAVHSLLAPNVCDRTEYASIASSLLNQSFDALDFVTNVKSSGDAGDEGKLTFTELLRQKFYALEGHDTQMSSMKRGFVEQYRHHSFFCAFYATLSPGSYAAGFLQEHYESSKVKRDRYEELYLTRVLLVKDFPHFGVFALSAEDLSTIYAQEELHYHRALTPEAVRRIVERLEREMRSGVSSSSARIKRHFLANIESRNEESFQRTLLQRTWQHFTKLLLQKVDFLTQLLTWPMYEGIHMPLTRAEIVEILSSF